MNTLKEEDINTQPMPEQDEQSITEEENNEDLYVSSIQDRESYFRMARNAMQIMKSWRTCAGEWKLAKGSNPVEGCVKIQQFEDHGLVYLLQATLDIHPSIIFDDLAYNTKEQPKWNKFVSTFNILEKLDDNYDVVYCIVPGRLCGLVNARDFVIVRHHTKEHDEYVHSACSIKHANMPEQRNMVRGVNGPSGWILESVPGEVDKCNFFWFVNTDVKVPLPKPILKMGVSSKLMDYLKLLRQRIDTLNQRASATNTTTTATPKTANGI